MKKHFRSSALRNELAREHHEHQAAVLRNRSTTAAFKRASHVSVVIKKRKRPLIMDMAFVIRGFRRIEGLLTLKHAKAVAA